MIENLLLLRLCYILVCVSCVWAKDMSCVHGCAFFLWCNIANCRSLTWCALFNGRQDSGADWKVVGFFVPKSRSGSVFAVSFILWNLFCISLLHFCVGKRYLRSGSMRLAVSMRSPHLCCWVSIRFKPISST